MCFHLRLQERAASSHGLKVFQGFLGSYPWELMIAVVRPLLSPRLNRCMMPWELMSISEAVTSLLNSDMK